MPRPLYILMLCLLLSSCEPYRFAKGHVVRTTRRAGLEHHQLKSGRFSLSYWDSQKDKPVLFLIHGLGAESEFHWYKQLKQLEEYRVIMPDLLYFGDSQTEKDNHSVIEQVRAMQALVERLGLKEFYLCGFSYGGLVAAELAKAEPRKIKKLVLMDAPVKYFNREDMQPLLSKYGLSEPSELLVPENAKAMKDLSGLIYVHPPRIPMSFHKSFQENVYMKNGGHYKKILKTLEKERAYFELQDYSFRFPVLLIWGERDIIVPVSVGKDLQKYIGSNAKLVIIPKTAHAPNLERPAEFNRCLTEFLEEQEHTEMTVKK